MSSRATGVELLLFETEDDAAPSRVFSLDSPADRTYHYWHAVVPGLRTGQLGGYRIHGRSVVALLAGGEAA